MKSEINVYMPNHCIINEKNVSKKNNEIINIAFTYPNIISLKKL